LPARGGTHWLPAAPKRARRVEGRAGGEPAPSFRGPLPAIRAECECEATSQTLRSCRRRRLQPTLRLATASPRAPELGPTMLRPSSTSPTRLSRVEPPWLSTRGDSGPAAPADPPVSTLQRLLRRLAWAPLSKATLASSPVALTMVLTQISRVEVARFGENGQNGSNRRLWRVGTIAAEIENHIDSRKPPPTWAITPSGHPGSELREPIAWRMPLRALRRKGFIY
jgi:hypothetical protein